MWNQKVTDIEGFDAVLRELKLNLDTKRLLGDDYRSLAGAFKKNIKYTAYLERPGISPVEELLKDCNPTLRYLHTLLIDTVKRKSVAELISNWVQEQGHSCSDCSSSK